MNQELNERKRERHLSIGLNDGTEITGPLAWLILILISPALLLFAIVLIPAYWQLRKEGRRFETGGEIQTKIGPQTCTVRQRTYH